MSRSAFMDDPRNDQRIEAPLGPVGHLPQDTGDGYRGLTTQMAWRTASVLFAVTAAACVLQATGGLFGDAVANTTAVNALAALALLCSGVWWHLSTRAVDARWLHAVPLISYFVLAAVLRKAPLVEAHLGIAYLLPLIFAAPYLPSRALVFYIALSVAFIAYSTSVHANGGFGLVPALMVTAALVTTASLTLYVRLQLDRIGRQAAFLSGRDALTGLANLRSLYERVDLMIRRAAREETGLTAIMLDLQGFKRVNDQHSHSVGDAMLRAAARALAECVRREELVARRGGDEFAVVAVGADVRDANALAERIKNAVRRERLKLCPDVSPETSVGVAEWRAGEQPADLLRRADAALHVSKMIAHTQDPFAET